MKNLKLLICYSYNDTLLSCGNMIEAAFRRRNDVDVYRLGEINPQDADVVFNTEAKAERPHGKITAWWDIEACYYQVTDEFTSDIVLAPYTLDPNPYPEGKTYFFPFANDPVNFKNYPDVQLEYDLGFVGREDADRTKRVEYLNWLGQQDLNYFRTNGVARGEAVSRMLSKAKILLQVSGDAHKGVMETRFFEIGPINLIAADRHDYNRNDMDWAAVPDYHYIAYETKEELLEKVKRVSADDELRVRMLTRARENYTKNHTYDVRVQKFLETIGFLKGSGLDNYHTRRKRWGEYNA